MSQNNTGNVDKSEESWREKFREAIKGQEEEVTEFLRMQKWIGRDAGLEAVSEEQAHVMAANPKRFLGTMSWNDGLMDFLCEDGVDYGPQALTYSVGWLGNGDLLLTCNHCWVTTVIRGDSRIALSNEDQER